jgi:hypothetical protein
LKESSKEGSNRTDTLYRPIEIANLYRITHKDNKLKDLNKYITYSWIHNVKAYKTMREKLIGKYLELIERENIKLEKKDVRRNKKNKKYRLLLILFHQFLKDLPVNHRLLLKNWLQFARTL